MALAGLGVAREDLACALGAMAWDAEIEASEAVETATPARLATSRMVGALFIEPLR